MLDIPTYSSVSGCGFIIPCQEASDQILNIVEGPLSQVIWVDQLQLSKQLNLQSKKPIDIQPLMLYNILYSGKFSLG